MTDQNKRIAIRLGTLLLLEACQVMTPREMRHVLWMVQEEDITGLATWIRDNSLLESHNDTNQAITDAITNTP